MSAISDRLLPYFEKSGMSYSDLSEMTGVPKSALQRYCTGATENIPLDRLKKIAIALEAPVTYLLGWEDVNTGAPDNITPLPNMRSVPLVGTIACGTPILAEENIDGMVDMPEHVRADFALRCKGDSMINARIFDGDIVYIRKQDTVDNGEIAAVLIEDVATLKRVRLFDDHISLEPENPQYRPIVYWGDEMNNVKILGLAVAFTSKVR